MCGSTPPSGQVLVGQRHCGLVRLVRSVVVGRGDPFMVMRVGVDWELVGPVPERLVGGEEGKTARAEMFWGGRCNF